MFEAAVAKSGPPILADGEINTARDWRKWRDTLVFREELRAIGESPSKIEEAHGR